MGVQQDRRRTGRRRVASDDGWGAALADDADVTILLFVDKKVVSNFAFRSGELDAKAIDLTLTQGIGKGKVALGIYELDGDTLKLCFPQDEKVARPTKFASTDGSRHVLITMRRQKGK